MEVASTDWIAAPRGTSDLLRAIAVTSVFDGRPVLRGVDLAVRRGEVLVIMGPSGCGKTTMLRHLCGLRAPDTGSVFLNGRDIYQLRPDELTVFRQRTGMAFQGGALLGGMSVVANVALPIRESTNLPEPVVEQIARMKLDMVGLLDAAERMPAELSGGMRKRAAIARAIALDPALVFLDEPSAGLDPVTAAEIDHLIRQLNTVFGITMVVVTHDLPSAWEIADRVAVFMDGEVAMVGTRQQVWDSPDLRIRELVDRRKRDTMTRRSDIGRHLAP